MFNKFFILLGFVCLIFSGVSFAQDDEEDLDTEVGDEDEPTNVIDDAFVGVADTEVEEEKIITSSHDVMATSIFPRYPDAQLPVGKILELLLGFKNTGQKTFNVTAIRGSFRYPGDLSIYLHNFTSWRGSTIVGPGEHQTFQYYFGDQMLEPKDYHFVVTMAYTDEDNTNYQTVFYNSTVYITEDALPFDLQTFFAYFLVLAILGLIGYVGYTSFGKKKGLNLFSKPSKTVETGTKDQSSKDNDYLADSNLSSWNKKKQQRKK